MEDGSNITKQNNVGRMDLIKGHVRETKSAIEFTAATAETHPERWEWLPDIYRALTADGGTVLFDVSGNGIHIPAPKTAVAESSSQSAE